MDWAFCFDDWSDQYADVEVQTAVESIKQCLRNPIVQQDDPPFYRLTKSLFGRFFQTAGPRCAKRFIQTMDQYLDGVVYEVTSRECDILDSQHYTTLRRKTSGLYPSFVLTEFAAGLDLPDEVTDNPAIRSMEDAANDWVSWTNDIFSYRKEEVVGGTHNLVAVIMNELDLDLQSAMDRAGQMCFSCITRFEADRRILPSWGSEIDQQVETYIQGLQSWIVGSLHWSFACQRYFESRGEKIKNHRVVDLIPRG
ncbi:hypothetical protein QCA50_006003 [Cerrena zonata]|uniref:Terpene synthase n=1 Tax=Cerrena zonata TaxID=2478898 RepID=A0AAW0GN07_9APHY